METLKVESQDDWFRRSRGEIEARKIRSLEVEVLVDTGSFHVGLNRSHIEDLGLLYVRSLPVHTAGGLRQMRMFTGALMSMRDRYTELPILELPDDVPPLAGVLLLEALDLMVDPKSQRVIPNPLESSKYLVSPFPVDILDIVKRQAAGGR